MREATFLELATEWKYCGIDKAEITLLDSCSVVVETWVAIVEGLIRRDTRDAEGYMAATLLKVEIPGVARYTLSGGRTNGRQRENKST